MSPTIYVEGGGNTRETKIRCRRGFSTFFQKFLGCSPEIVACGPRSEALDRFRLALQQRREAGVVLLIDSEGPVLPEVSAWEFLKRNDNWSPPAGATDGNTYLMVQCVEAWFLADRQALVTFYGKDFNTNALPQQPDVERVSKTEVFRRLEQATRSTKKGAYTKGTHGFELLTHIDPAKVFAASVHAKRLFEHLRASD